MKVPFGAVLITTFLAFMGSEAAQAGTGIASSYPGDVGIQSDSRVIFVEDFETGTLTSLGTRWDQILNESGMRFVTDVPAGSRGVRALRMTSGGSSTTGGHLYTRLPSGHDRLYFRYYVRYGAGSYHHAGGWFGGFNPPSPWLQGGSGERPVGNERFTVAFEPQSDGRLDFYNYYMAMRGLPNGPFWGNSFLQDPKIRIRTGEWTCIEVMVKLNDPLGTSNGELAVWIDGQPVTHLGPGFPTGTWGPGVWTPSSSGQPFEGFRWRKDSNLKLNFVWLLYYTTANPAGFVGQLDWDQVVVATEYIGPIVRDSSPIDSPPPAPILLD